MSVPPVAPHSASPALDTGPRHPNDAAPGRITKGGSLLTGGYLGHKIYVGNLPESATLADLEDCFGQIGPCACVLKRGFGFVEYEQPGHAAEAVAKYNEGHFLGSQIKVELSLARAPIGKGDGPGSVPPQLRGPNPPGSDRPSDPRKPMWINGAPGGAPPRGGRGPPPGYGGGGGGYGGPPGYGGGGGYGEPRYDGRPPFDRPGYGPPPRGGDFDRYGPPPPRGGAPPVPYGGPPVDRPPYDPYFDRSAPRPDYPPYPLPGAAPGYPPVAPYDRPPYGAGAPVPPPPGPAIPPYGADRGYPPPGGLGRSPVMPPPEAPGARPPYGAPPPLDPYARSGPPLDNGPPPPSGYDPRDERGAGSRYQPYPLRDDRGRGDSYGGGRSPNRGPPSERRRSLSPRRGGDSGYSNGNGYAPYDSRGPPSNGNGYGPPPFDRNRSPPRYPPADEYVPRR